MRLAKQRMTDLISPLRSATTIPDPHCTLNHSNSNCVQQSNQRHCLAHRRWLKQPALGTRAGQNHDGVPSHNIDQLKHWALLPCAASNPVKAMGLTVAASPLRTIDRVAHKPASRSPATSHVSSPPRGEHCRARSGRSPVPSRTRQYGAQAPHARFRLPDPRLCPHQGAECSVTQSPACFRRLHAVSCNRASQHLLISSKSIECKALSLPVAKATSGRQVCDDGQTWLAKNALKRALHQYLTPPYEVELSIIHCARVKQLCMQQEARAVSCHIDTAISLCSEDRFRCQEAYEHFHAPYSGVTPAAVTMTDMIHPPV